MANFRTKARAIDLLGRNQIADLPTAITELWKNGYDAYGDYLDAALYREGYKDVKHDIFTISDDGFGMSEDDILNKWIVIGTESKRQTHSMIPEEDRFGKEIRVPLGEKGIGRLSVTYLGNHMLMITKKQDAPFQLVFMNWRALENYELYLDEIEIPLSTCNNVLEIEQEYNKLQRLYLKNFNSDSWEHFVELKNEIFDDLALYRKLPEAVLENVQEHFLKKQHGTFFVIFDPISEIKNLDKEPENMLQEEIEELEEQKRYVRSALSGLFNPFDEKLINNRKEILGEDFDKSPSFMIYRQDENKHDFLALKEFFTVDEFNDCEHWIDGIFDEEGVFTGKIKVFGNIQDYVYAPRGKSKVNIGKLILKLAFWEGQKSNSSMKGDIWLNYEKKGDTFSGLYVYRDGFRVLPYGRTDFDFLEFETRRSKGAGVYYFSHRKMIGYIGITKAGNGKLIDKSGREGFVSNDAYRAMKTLLKNFFIEIAKDRYGKLSETRTEYLEEKKKEKERTKLIEEEKKRNNKIVNAIRKDVKERKQKLDEQKKHIMNLKQRIEAQIQTRKLLEDEAKQLLQEVSALRKEIFSAKIVVPSDVTLTGYDSVKDMLHDYEEERETVEKLVSECSKMANENIYVNVLKEEYCQRFYDVRKEIDEVIRKIEKQQKETVTRLGNMFDEELLNIRKELSEFVPDAIKISSLSEEQTVEKIESLDILLEEFREKSKQIYSPFIDRLASISIEEDQGKLLEAYKSKEIELVKQVDTFYELAQVGMSIEVIDHQFNVLYAQMANAINDLHSIAKDDKKIERIYKPLKMSFQHLESNHKMLIPMYRTTRRNKRIITGIDIMELVLEFYGEAFAKEGIIFECTKNFKKFKFNSFESIIMPVFLNVINNAVYWVGYAKNERIIRLDVKNEEVLLLNSGAKMSYTELTKCFEIFYTKKVSGRGVGLYLAKKCLNSVSLDIYATNAEEYNTLGGACFVICEYKGE